MRNLSPGRDYKASSRPLRRAKSAKSARGGRHEHSKAAGDDAGQNRAGLCPHETIGWSPGSPPKATLSLLSRCSRFPPPLASVPRQKLGDLGVRVIYSTVLARAERSSHRPEPRPGYGRLSRHWSFERGGGGGGEGVAREVGKGKEKGGGGGEGGKVNLLAGFPPVTHANSPTWGYLVVIFFELCHYTTSPIIAYTL